MGRVISVEHNDLGEVTAARVKKGLTGEIVYRHSSSLIYLLTDKSEQVQSESTGEQQGAPGGGEIIGHQSSGRPNRKAAHISRERTEALIHQQLV